MKEKLLSRIAERKITVGVVGLGYVGLPLAVEKAKAGFRTIGFDVQEEKVKQVNAGHNYIGDVVDAELAQLVRNGTLSATSDFSFIKDVDFVSRLCLRLWMCTRNRTSAMWRLRGEINSRASDRRHHRGAGVHNLSRHYRRAYKTDS